MSDFSTSFSDLKDKMSKLQAANAALEANTDPTLDDDLMLEVISAVEDLSVADADVNQISTQEQNVVINETASLITPAETEVSNLLITAPIKLTTSSGNERPRMAIDDADNIWLTWHSNRSGIQEIYVAKYFGHCGVWSTSGMGGEEKKISNFGDRKCSSPSIAVGADGEAHVVFQVQSETGKWDIYYSQSTGKGASFTPPLRITDGKSNALMPDVAVMQPTKQDLAGSTPRVVIVWHDDRFGDFEIISAEKNLGKWTSSGQGSSDTRITQAAGNSMFPRLSADNRGNLRVVYHDSRRGDDLSGIYMSTFVSIEERWESSGQGGQDRLVSSGPADSLHPDIAIDETGGISVVWHDFRDSVADPDFHEEVYALYCPKQGHPGVHYPPLQPNIEARLDVDLKIKDSVTYQDITMTDVPEVSLAIKAPNATFWRAANEDGNYSDWQAFKPNFDLETMIVPWTLICTGGKKQICVQVQDAEMVAFPICREVTLTLQPPEFKIEFFEDDKMTVPLASFKDKPVTKKGNVYVKFSAKSPQILPPKFDVISAGQRLIFNQETDPLEDVTGGAGIGSYIGKVVTTSRKGDVSPAALAFSAAAGRTFKGRFEVKRHDGLLNVDGLARVIVRPRDLCGEVKSGIKQETAEGPPIGKSETKPNLRTDKPSNDLNKFKKPYQPPIDYHPIPSDPGPLYFTIKTHLEPELPWTSTYKNIYKWRLFSEGGDGYPSLSWDGTNFYANPSIVGTYAVIHRFRIKGGYVLPQGGFVTAAKLLRMRIKVIALDNPSSLLVEVCKYNNPLEQFPNGTVSLGEPLETISLPGTSLPTWTLDAYNQYLPARHPNDNIEQAKSEFRSIPMLTVEFGGSTIVTPSLAVEDPNSPIDPITGKHIGTILNPYSQDYCIVLREAGDINTDPSGRFVIYANGNGFGRNTQEFSSPLVSSYREQWSNRESIYAVQGDVRLPWSYMELDFVSA